MASTKLGTCGCEKINQGITDPYLPHGDFSWAYQYLFPDDFPRCPAVGGGCGCGCGCGGGGKSGSAPAGMQEAQDTIQSVQGMTTPPQSGAYAGPGYRNPGNGNHVLNVAGPSSGGRDAGL